MLGAIYGDIIGSRFEVQNHKSKEFTLITDESSFTDDSVMTIAIGAALLDYFETENGTGDLFDSTEEEKLTRCTIVCMKKYGRRYPNAGYGGRFSRWLRYGIHPYNSWGNGSAMRVSPVAWVFDDIAIVRRAAAITAAVTHNHPEGIKGAEAIASAVFLARTGKGKAEIKEYITNEFGYDLDYTCEEIRPYYRFDVSCQGSVPQAIVAFIDGEDFLDVVRTAVSIGGDSDTIAAMAGSIAEAFYGLPVPAELKEEECGKADPQHVSDYEYELNQVYSLLMPDLKDVVRRFRKIMH